MKQWVWVVTLLLCTLIFTLGNRYSVSHDNTFWVRLDRFTGKTWILVQNNWVKTHE